MTIAYFYQFSRISAKAFYGFHIGFPKPCFWENVTLDWEKDIFAFGNSTVYRYQLYSYKEKTQRIITSAAWIAVHFLEKHRYCP